MNYRHFTQYPIGKKRYSIDKFGTPRWLVFIIPDPNSGRFAIHEKRFI